jgi:hypothetical protein
MVWNSVRKTEKRHEAAPLVEQGMSTWKTPNEKGVIHPTPSGMFKQTGEGVCVCVCVCMRIYVWVGGGGANAIMRPHYERHSLHSRAR